MREFITPNWHVLLLHYPLALVTLGLLAALLACRRPDGEVRRSGWCMLALGSLLALPAATAGVYAFRDVVTPEPLQLGQTWAQVVQHSTWTEAQWNFMETHIWYNSGAAVLLVLLAFLYLAGSDAARRRMYWPLVFGFIVGAGLLLAGGWHGGEAVYRFGTAVEADASVERAQGIEYFLQPLQMHVVLGGLVVAGAVLAGAQTIRRWQMAAALAEERAEAQRAASASAPREAMPERASEPSQLGAGRLWVLVTLLALLTAFFGIWSVAGDLSVDSLESVLHESTEAGHERLMFHAIGGIAILLLPLIVAAFVRFTPRHRALTSIPAVLLYVIAAGQMWLGVAMLFDSHEGPLLRFNTSAAEVAEPHLHDPADAVNDAPREGEPE